MSKAKVLLVLAFIVVCAAGVVVGTAVDRHARPPAPPERLGFPELNLSPEQKAKMKEIWNPVMELRGQMFHQRHQLEQQRLEKIQAMLTPEQKTEYLQIQSDFEKQNKQSEDQIREASTKADVQMRAILTEAQIKKLEEMRQKMPHGMGPPGMGPPGMGPPHGHHEHHHSSTRPTTEPATEPV